MSKIKLLKIGTLKEGTIRLQSQLMLGKSTADYVLENGILKCWGHKKGDWNFHETDEDYEIVTKRSEMYKQQL